MIKVTGQVAAFAPAPSQPFQGPSKLETTLCTGALTEAKIQLTKLLIFIKVLRTFPAVKQNLLPYTNKGSEKGGQSFIKLQ